MIERFEFGRPGGRSVEGFTLRNRNGISAKLITFGARLTELHVPDSKGQMADVVLGFDDVESYDAKGAYYGATCGRYANRIKRGQYTLAGSMAQLSCNEGKNHLHGGFLGFDRKIWQASANEAENSVTFTLHSPDGDEGYPGNFDVSATYTLRDDNSLYIRMQATTDKATVANIVNHSYFNLAGHGSGDVLKQVLHLNADFYTPVDGELIPTGEVLGVAGTPFDFTKAKAIGQDIAHLQTVRTGSLVGGGYDHNWCLASSGHPLGLCARAVDPASGRVMEVWTDQPGVQVYTGGYIDPALMGKGGLPLGRLGGYTFETQKFPNSPGNAHFPSSALQPGEAYDHHMEFRFSTT